MSITQGEEKKKIVNAGPFFSPHLSNSISNRPIHINAEGGTAEPAKTSVIAPDESAPILSFFFFFLYFIGDHFPPEWRSAGRDRILYLEGADTHLCSSCRTILRKSNRWS